ncbi:Uncharacterized membrane protein YczE [Pilibacter termitis]|uniref:Uncharacterized membrane protein YczE n=1 Tax=Pilibacter termitis TaxID=263852 RepID=A0A1T4QGV0_9ENTE|nr:hypothetical protein [Pilibacter termitis]SKA02945.1 Uncharacterized membrane protein YczE [Pilibacter termitis]
MRKNGEEMKKELFVRLLYALIGDIILALGAALLIFASLGVDAFTVANLGAAGKLGWSLGVYQMTFGLVVGLIILLFKRHHLGYASIINILLTGYFIDFFMFLFGSHSPENIVVKVLIMLVALLIYSLGISLYSTSGLGAGPYDALAPVLSEITGWKFMNCRILVDSTFFILGFFLGGPIGVASLLTAVFLGPLINIFNQTITNPSLAKFLGK